MIAQQATVDAALPSSANARLNPAAIIALTVGIITALWAHQASVAEAVAVWNRTDTYRFSWVVLPTVLFLIWYRRPHLGHASSNGHVWGVAGAAAAVIVWLAADLMNISEGRQLALLAGVLAIVLASVGLSAFRQLMPTLALLVFLVPTGGFLLTPLKLIAVRLLGLFASVFGMPFASDGFTVFIGEQRYVVIDDCAGLPYVLIGLFLGLTLGLLIFRRAWKIVTMALLGGALAVLGNSIRIISIAVYDHLTGAELDFAGHVAIERPVMGFAFITLFAIFAFLRADPDFARSPTQCSDAIARRAPIFACLLAASIVALTPPAWGAYQRGLGASERLAVLPATLAGWTQESKRLDWKPRASDASLQLSGYSRGSQSIAVFLAQAQNWRDKISDGGVDLKGDGDWMLSAQSILPVCSELACRDIRYSKYVWPDSDRVRHVYSVHAIGAWTTVSTMSLRFHRAWALIKGMAPTPQLVAVAFDGSESLAHAELAGVFERLLVR